MVRWISAGLAASVAALGYGIGFIGIRTTLFAQGSQLGLDVTQLVMTTSVAAIVGTVAAGGIALLIGPSATGALGLATCAFGAALLTSPATFSWGALLGALGAGMFRPSLYAMAARPFPQGSAWVPTLLVFAYLGLNSGMFVGPEIARSYPPELAVAPLFAGMLGLAAVVCGIDAALQWLAPPSEAERAAATGTPGQPVVAAIAVALALVCVHPMWSLAMSGLYRGTTSWAATANPVGVLVAGVPLALILSFVALTDRRVPVLLLGGIGFVGVGAAALAVVLLGETSVDPIVLAGPALIGGMAEVIAFPVVMAAMVRGVPWRLSTAIAGLPVVGSGLFNLLPVTPGIGASLIGAGAVIVFGVGMAATARPFERWAKGYGSSVATCCTADTPGGAHCAPHLEEPACGRS